MTLFAQSSLICNIDPDATYSGKNCRYIYNSLSTLFWIVRSSLIVWNNRLEKITHSCPVHDHFYVIYAFHIFPINRRRHNAPCTRRPPPPRRRFGQPSRCAWFDERFVALNINDRRTRLLFDVFVHFEASFCAFTQFDPSERISRKTFNHFFILSSVATTHKSKTLDLHAFVYVCQIMGFPAKSARGFRTRSRTAPE